MNLVLLALITCGFVVVPSLFFAMPSADAPGAVQDGTGKGEHLRVLWTVAGYRFGRNPEWDAQEARALLFKPLDITATSIQFNDKMCRDVSFAVEEVEAGPYFEDHLGVSPEEFQISGEKKIQVVRTNCPLPGFAEYVRLPDRRLIVPMHGILFIFDPAVQY